MPLWMLFQILDQLWLKLILFSMKEKYQKGNTMHCGIYCIGEDSQDISLPLF